LRVFKGDQMNVVVVGTLVSAGSDTRVRYRAQSVAQLINPQEKQGKTMRMKAVLQTVGGSIALVVALNVCAQPGTASVPASSAVASSNAKAVKAANKKLRRDVLRALAKTPGLSNERISVRVSGSAVALSGSVPAADQIQKAGDVVQQVPGVTAVNNKLTARAYN
jgi:hyperosmotically inducible protein